MTEKKCPCDSGKDYKDCCKDIITGVRKAETAEDLMRSRYAAYALAEVDHIINSTHQSQRESNDRDEIKKWAEKSEWLGLQIINCERGGREDQDGIVEFKAHYSDHTMRMEHHEIAEFRRVDGDWFFYDGKMVPQKPFTRTEPRIGRNDPCSCASGKKYKKCCGK